MMACQKDPGHPAGIRYDMGPMDDEEGDAEVTVTAAIQPMLSSREKFETLAAYARGGNAGIGVQLLMEQTRGIMESQ